MNSHGTRVARIGSMIVVLASAASALAGEAVELKAKFPAGRTRYLELKRDVAQKLSAPMNMEYETKTLDGFLERVSSGADGGSKVVMTYDRTLMTMDNPMMGGEVSFDSDMPTPDDARAVKDFLSPLIGEAFTIEFDKNGKPTKVSGMEKIREKIEKNVTGNPLYGLMKLRYTDDVMKSQFGHGPYVMLPGKKVSAGDKWKAEYEDTIPRMGKIKFDFDCKLDKITQEGGKRVAVIVYTARMTQLEPDKGPNPMGPMTFEGGTVKGTLDFAVDEGEAVRAESQSDLKLTVNMPSQSGAGGDEEEDDADEEGKKEQKKSDGQTMTVEVGVKEVVTAKTSSEREKEKKENAEKAKKLAEEEEEEDEEEEDPGV